MDAQATEECLVCGTETKNRCSSCAKAEIDLFLLAGTPEAPLSPEQVRVAIAELDSSTYSAAAATPVIPLATLLTFVSGVPRDALPDALGRLTHTSDPQMPAESHALILVRVYLHLRLRSESRESAARVDPVGYVVVVCRSISVFECHGRWTTGFQHRLSVFAALQTLFSKQEAAVRNLGGVVTRLFSYLNNVAYTEDSHGAELVAAKFNELLEATYGGRAPLGKAGLGA
ncbi:hypothetical protein JCM10296v2_003373 [Rhodotorula toruloides]